MAINATEFKRLISCDGKHETLKELFACISCSLILEGA